MSYKNARREIEDIVLASILQNGTVPDRIRMQMELSGGKWYEENRYPLISISNNIAKPFQKQICGGRKILVFFPYNG